MNTPASNTASLPPTSTATASPSRRRFLKRGVALTVAFSLLPAFDSVAQQPEAKPLPGSLQNNRKLDGWLRINADGTVTVFTGKAELGQGILTALSQIVADELDVAFGRVRIVSADTALTPNEGVTSGSLSIENSGTALRYASAEARHLLLRAAAEKLNAPQEDLQVVDGVITAPNGDKASYWELTGDAMLARDASASITPKAAGKHRVVGTEVQRIDLPGKMTGAPSYVQDMRLPDMVFGRVVRPPSPRARLMSLDDGPVRQMPGVIAVVVDGSFVAVAANREEQAIAAMQALRSAAKWEEVHDLPPSGAELFKHMKTAMRKETSIASDKTDPSPLPSGIKTVQAAYTRAFMSHASIGPSCAVAHLRDGKLHVWSHTQGVFPLRTDLAKTLAMKPADVTVTHVAGSGCYGQNGADDVALDAALLARATGGRPVKLQWMREDEFSWAPYGSAMAFEMRGSVDSAGRIVEWNHELWSHAHSMRPGDREGNNLLASWYLEKPFKIGRGKNNPLPAGGGDRNAIPLYNFPRQHIVNNLLPDMPVRVSALRTLGAYGNVFALESFMDELALAARVDPVEFRLRHLDDPRAKTVIETVAKKAAWHATHARGAGRGRGIGFAKYKNHATYAAVVADVEVDRSSGAIRVVKLWAAAEGGQIINPNGFRNQIEGGMIQSSSWTLFEAVKFGSAGMLTKSWLDYRIMRFPEVPDVEVTLIDRPDLPSLGAGEAVHGPTVAAIANAVADALGSRVREVPMSPEAVKRAVDEARNLKRA
ncbi:MAG: aldehyde oxidase and xanthine dehydrogenase molybdopterin-binding protein [Herminiimonas sp.]|nr:aldehyde oxidase and xanthine dehydrogenase molybdopterin-binding protein [Herminiimonas sp.]